MQMENKGGPYRFVAFSVVLEVPLGHGSLATEAMKRAAYMPFGSSAYVEILDCGEGGQKLWMDGMRPG